jgi:hypothetical protein
MPAYFCDGKDGRKKSFQIGFGSLSENDEYDMACEAYQMMEDFYTKATSTMERTWIVRLGEDAMIGAYVISKLGHPELVFDVEKMLTEENIDRFRGKLKNVDVDLVSQEKGLRTYLEFCTERGEIFARDSLPVWENWLEDFKKRYN